MTTTEQGRIYTCSCEAYKLEIEELRKLCADAAKLLQRLGGYPWMYERLEKAGAQGRSE